MSRVKTFIWLILGIMLILRNTEAVTAQNNLFNMSYIFFGSPSNYIKQVKSTQGSLNVVSPNYFDLTKDGELEITWTLQSSFIKDMHAQGIKVVPFLSNHWNADAGIKGLENSKKLANDIAAAIKKYDLDGVNVDIEGVGSKYKDAHTNFIKLLRQYIPENKEVSVAVAANPNGWKTGWHGFYDYKGLSEHADYLMIMAYDESWESPDSPIGPVASYSFSEKSILYAINQGVPKNKIVYGLPFYGRIWKLDGSTSDGKSITGLGLSTPRVEDLIKTFSAKELFDEKFQTAYATFTIPGGEHFYLGNTKLTQGDYIVWYENERSLKAKLRLPSKYGIKGTGSWALYHETPKTWNYYSAWLNGQYFADVISDYWAEDHINFVSQKGWMQGTSSTTFAPKSPLTRAEGAVILVRALGKVDINPKSYEFDDTKNHWARKEIEIARELGYLQGVGKGRFSPQSPLTREQLATILDNIFAYEIKEPIDESPFIDISPKDWSFDAVVAIYQQGHLEGVGNGRFGKKNTSTRAEMAALMQRMSADIENKQIQ